MHKWIVPFLIYICLFSFGNNKTIASSFWTPDSDTALLFQLVSNSMTQINELEQLISNAQKHTETFEKYNQLAKDYYFRAERIQYIAESFVDLSKKDTKDLEELNSAIRALKSERESLQALIREYREEEANNEIQETSIAREVKKSEREIAFANSQVDKTVGITSTNTAQKLIAQNTSLTYKSQVENNQISQVMANKLAQQNKLVSRQMKNEQIAELERSKYYSLQDKRSKRKRGELGASK